MSKRPGIRTNAVKAAIAAGRKAKGCHFKFAEPDLIESIGTLAFDFIYLDAEHGRFTLSEIENCCRAAELYDLTVILRIPQIEPNLISQVLNAGVLGLIAPHADSADDVKRFVDASMMGPRGSRPNGGSRSNGFWHGVDDLPTAIDAVNRNVSLSIQIESRAAVDAIDDILAVDGIDYYTVGKADLGQSLGFPRQPNGHHPGVLAVAAEIEGKIRERGGRLKDDVMTIGRAGSFMMQGARQFLAKADS